MSVGSAARAGVDRVGRRSSPRIGLASEADQGAASVEYALIAVAIAAVVAVTVYVLGAKVLAIFSDFGLSWP